MINIKIQKSGIFFYIEVHVLDQIILDPRLFESKEAAKKHAKAYKLNKPK